MRASTGLAALMALTNLAALAQDTRPMENLGRGVVAVRSSDDDVLITWRLLGLDPDDIGFNIYRSTDSGSPTQLNTDPLTNGTNYLDTNATLTSSNTYFIRPVVSDKEQSRSASFTLPADSATEPIIRIPVRSTGSMKYVWVGDLDGDGEYDFVVDRHNERQSVEAYSSNGTFLWEVDLGPNSENQNNISPGSTAISTGNWDGVTVYDFDSDGYAEVAIRIANGVTFGDGETFSHDDDDVQFVAILDGRTGKLRAKSQIPDDYIEHGPLGARFGVGYLDGRTPHLVAFMKVRREDKKFMRMQGAWTFDGESVTEEWILRDNATDGADGHNTRILDVNGDGKDDVAEIGFVISGEGKILYKMPDQVVHGDRFHIAKMDPTRDGLQGYGIQQDNPDGLMEYYYDAGTGEMIWEHYEDETGDVARGMAGDIDPTHPGYEVWSFSGVYNAASNELTTDDAALAPWPHLGVWWDGDELLELLNDGKIEKWDWENPSESGGVPRLVTAGSFGAKSMGGRYPGFVGDILGDWREEVIMTNDANDELIIFTTDQPSEIRLYTLAHNPAYRNAMTLKGYLQSHHVDYFLGKDMETPAQPKIHYVGA
ncbi:hypothetical protein P170DRAFT_433511 [Aspergillus steynii IBT 23096]|uniref:Uncharacterized protein n=1 Tax=Aspergillus steynii IBT 23096 TaxID=1392250 RepID=A0A2I2GFE0_9EURO|nr:uncharacterized protein P170DRAFT_433511 [Aspergillus steynii IBT 23096]PLB51596.1 hypothetical protein P170DRAFT_433511 [Aspergillus steynii IBT 23096]